MKWLVYFVMFNMVFSQFFIFGANFASADSSGSIWTTTSDCGAPQNVNHYEVDDNVYINGAGFSSSSSYSWNITAVPADKNTAVAEGDYDTDGDGNFCFLAHTIKSGESGVYKANYNNKQDTYSVGDGVFSPEEGDVIVSEIMPNPNAVDDDSGEWFEIYNTTNEDFNLKGCLATDYDNDDFYVENDLIILSGEYLVFGINGTSGENGGVTVDYEYDDFNLNNTSADKILIECGDVEIDKVAFDQNWPFGVGVSMLLNDYSDNDDKNNWCESTSSYGDGDLGTPGAVNDTCEPVYCSDDTGCSYEEFCDSGVCEIIPAVCADDDDDGYSVEGGDCGMIDCDDGDSSVNPGQKEICGDEIDQDCDGSDLVCSDTGTGCKLELIKTAQQSTVYAGGEIIYDLTLENTGDTNCTGGGVKLTDEFDLNTIYVDSSASDSGDSVTVINNVSSTQIEWNFGILVPGATGTAELIMEVSENVQCGDLIVNKAKYWSTETGYGDYVSATVEVLCDAEVCGDDDVVVIPGYINYVDIGLSISESAYILDDWSDIWTWGGTYGGGSSDGSFRLLMGPGDGCGSGYESASITFDVGDKYVDNIVFEHLDGAVDDSFDIYINNSVIGHYTGGQNSGESWVESEYGFPGVTGEVVVKFVATEPNNSWCDDWGQVAFSWLGLEGYDCNDAPEDVCGDGTVDNEEQCDGGDLCGDDCQFVFCGDDVVNQEWEECDGADVDSGLTCNEMCQIVEDNTCSDLVLARVNVEDVNDTGNGEMNDRVYLGSDSYYIPGGAWFALYLDENYISDSNMYENVPGLAVQRTDGSVRAVMHTTLTQSDSEDIRGDLEFYNANTGDWGEDSLNPLEGVDELGLDGDTIVDFYMWANTGDDGFYADWSIIEDCGCEIGPVALLNPSFENQVEKFPKGWGVYVSDKIDWNISWIYLSELTPKLELQYGVNSWATSDPVNDFNYAELDSDGHGDEEASVVIDQDVNTFIGAEYLLTFDFSPRPNVDVNILEVYLNGTLAGTYSEDGSNNTNTVWESEEITFMADSAVTKIAFADGGDREDSNKLGTFIDNVELEIIDCIANFCGDGILDNGEQCDIDDDLCSDDCQLIFCGDGIANQDWEECDGDDGLDQGAVCTDKCTIEGSQDCSDLVLARVNIKEDEGVKNFEGEFSDMSSDIYLGSDWYHIPQGTWFALYSGNYGFYEDSAMDESPEYEDVPGLAVERSEGNVRALLYGSHVNDENGDKEHVYGNIEFYNASILNLGDDDTSKYPGENKLENGFDKTGTSTDLGDPNYDAGNDEVWVEDGKSFFWLTTTTADDGYYTGWEIIEDCGCDNVIDGYKKQHFEEWEEMGDGQDDWSTGGWVIELYDDSDNLIATTVTEMNGYYSFDARCDNETYIVKEQMKDGWKQIVPSSGYFEVAFPLVPETIYTIAVQQTLDDSILVDVFVENDFVNRPMVCGHKYDSGNGNIPKEGWGIEIERIAEFTVASVDYESFTVSTTTDIDGGYCFEVEPGTYKIIEEDRSGWVSQDGITSYEVDFVGNEPIFRDFYNYEEGSSNHSSSRRSSSWIPITTYVEETPIVKGEEGAPFLGISIDPELATARPGDKNVKFSITVSNMGNIDAINSELKVVLPDGLSYNDPAVSGTWALGDIAAGDDVVIDMYVDVSETSEIQTYSIAATAKADNNAEVSAPASVEVEIPMVLAETGFSFLEFIYLMFALFMTSASALYLRKTS